MFPSKICFVLIFAFLLNVDRLTTASPSNTDARNNFEKQKEELRLARLEYEKELAEWEAEKKLVENFIEKSKLIRFNVGGKWMFVSQGSVEHISDTKLGQILLEKTNEDVSRLDKQVFLDFDPKLFQHVLDQLREFETGDSIVFYPPDPPAAVPAFNFMLEKLGLKAAPPSPDDVFTFNVGDEIVATKRKTLSVVPGSKLSTLLTMDKPSDMDPEGRPFLDYDPKCFRYLLGQLQVGQTTDFEAPDDESRAAFNAMLKDFDLKPKSV